MLTRLIPLAALVVAASCACFDNGDKEIGGNCFRFVNQKLSFNDARDWCHYKNPVTASFLASVPNQFTDNFLATYARSEFGTNDGFFWIGLSREKSYTPWMFDTGYQASWTNFVNGQLGQNYGAESIVNGKWQTFGEGEKMPFVCMYDPTAPPTFGPPVTGTTAAPTTAGTTQSVPTTTATPTTYRRTTVTRGRVTPTVTPGSTTYTPSCPTPYRGKVAIAFELNSVQTELQKVVAFIRNFLFPLPIFKYHDGTSRVISVPYGGSFFYKNILEYNYTAGYYSVPILQANIDTLNKEAVSTTNATIYSAFQYLDAERDTYQSRAALIVVGVHDDYVNDESTQFTREILRVDQDYQLLAVSMGTGDLGSLANKRDWAFRVSDGNEQEIANKIGQVLCYLNW